MTNDPIPWQRAEISIQHIKLSSQTKVIINTIWELGAWKTEQSLKKRNSEKGPSK